MSASSTGSRWPLSPTRDGSIFTSKCESERYQSLIGELGMRSGSQNYRPFRHL